MCARLFLGDSRLASHFVVGILAKLVPSGDLFTWNKSKDFIEHLHIKSRAPIAWKSYAARPNTPFKDSKDIENVKHEKNTLGTSTTRPSDPSSGLFNCPSGSQLDILDIKRQGLKRLEISLCFGLFGLFHLFIGLSYSSVHCKDPAVGKLDFCFFLPKFLGGSAAVDPWDSIFCLAIEMRNIRKKNYGVNNLVDVHRIVQARHRGNQWNQGNK